MNKQHDQMQYLTRENVCPFCDSDNTVSLQNVYGSVSWCECGIVWVDDLVGFKQLHNFSTERKI